MGGLTTTELVVEYIWWVGAIQPAYIVTINSQLLQAFPSFISHLSAASTVHEDKRTSCSSAVLRQDAVSCKLYLPHSLFLVLHLKFTPIRLLGLLTPANQLRIIRLN